MRTAHHYNTRVWPPTQDQKRAILARNVLDALANNPPAVEICEQMLLQYLREEGHHTGFVEPGCIEHGIVHVWTVAGWLEINPITGEVTKC